MPLKDLAKPTQLNEFNKLNELNEFGQTDTDKRRGNKEQANKL